MKSTAFAGEGGQRLATHNVGWAARCRYTRLRMALPRALFASLAAVALLFRSGLALADKVTVLPFTGAGTTKAETDGMRDRLCEAATDRGHTLPSSSE